MHLILTGATGLVGSAVLDAMLRSKDVTRISVLSRRPVRMAADRNDPRVRVIQHGDFATYDAALLDQLRGAAGCVWALGISQTQVGPADYVAITRDYALAAARAFAALGPSPAAPFRFVYVSGEGATQTPGRFAAAFAHVKGETEQALADLAAETPTLRADSVRPALVDPAGQPDIRPYAPAHGLLFNAVSAALGTVVRCAWKRGHSPTEVLGPFLTDMAMGRVDDKLDGPGAFRLGPSWIVENVGFRRIMGL